MKNLITTKEISERYGVTRQWIHKLRKVGDFPEPILIVGNNSALWEEEKIRIYAKEKGWKVNDNRI